MSVNIRCRLCGIKCQEYLNIFDKEEIYVKISCCLQITVCLYLNLIYGLICNPIFSVFIYTKAKRCFFNTIITMFLFVNFRFQKRMYFLKLFVVLVVLI